MRISLFRTRPTHVEATRIMTVSEMQAAARWCDGEYVEDGLGCAVVVPTGDGTTRAQPGDWIVRDVGGEFGTVRHPVFVDTYEQVAWAV